MKWLASLFRRQKRDAPGFVSIPLVQSSQLPPGVPLDECLKQLKEPA
jgi:hypothetical protein